MNKVVLFVFFFGIVFFSSCTYEFKTPVYESFDYVKEKSDSTNVVGIITLRYTNMMRKSFDFFIENTGIYIGSTKIGDVTEMVPIAVKKYQEVLLPIEVTINKPKTISLLMGNLLFNKPIGLSFLGTAVIKKGVIKREIPFNEQMVFDPKKLASQFLK